MRDEEMATPNFLPTKKELQLSSKNFASKLIDSGNYNLEEIYAQALRAKEAISIIETELKKALPDENFEAFGIKANFRNGGNTINYSEDPVYADYKKQIKQREELIKTATNSDVKIYDEDGYEVPKVSKTPRKSALAISF